MSANPQPGDLVTIRWPGDTVTIRWPDNAAPIQPGGVVKVKLTSLLQIVETVNPTMAMPAAPPSNGKSTPCKRCGKPIYFVRSNKTGRWYTIDNPSDRASFHSKTCGVAAQEVV